MIVCDGCTGDGAINPYDSNLSGDVTTHLTATYSSDQSFPDPDTGQPVNSISVSAESDHLHVDAGYNNAGQTVVHTRFTDPIDPGTAADQQLSRSDMVDNAMTIADGNGSPMPYDPVPGVEPATPLDLMGDMVNADVTAGAVLDVNSDNADYDRNVPSLESVRAQLTRFAPDGRLTVTQISPTRLVVSENVPDDRIQASASKALKDGATLQPRFDGSGNEGGGHSITHRRLFERDGTHWILREATTIVDDTTRGMRVHSEHTVSLSKLHWFKNPVKDAERRKKRPHPTEVIPVSAPLVRSSLTIPGIRHMVSCDALPPDDPDYCGSGGGGGGGGGVDVGTDLGCSNDVVGYVHTNGTINLVLQHGGLSDATVWCGLEGYLREKFRVGFEIRHTTASSEHIEGQTFDLKTRIDGERGSEGHFIVVGHSNGGLIGRRLGQLTENDPSYVRGVLTISTPHQGFPLAKVQNQSAVILLQPIVATGCGYVLHIGCSLLGQHVYGYAAGILAGFTLQVGVPATQDDQPGSSYLNTLNSHPENFARAGIQDYAWDKWTMFRLIGDWQPGPFGNGRRLVKDVDRAYHFGIKCAVVSGIFGFVWHGAWRVAAGCAAFSAQLKGSDLLWKALSVPHQSGDGIVPGSSQIYPNAPVNNQFAVRDADSHLGVNKRGSTTAPQVVAAISSAFQVPIVPPPL